jgi:DNA-binding NarL/FixJ family response regulator
LSDAGGAHATLDRRSSIPPDSANLAEDSPLTAFPCFACYNCHRVRSLSRIERNSWNQLIGYLSGGLLYGREVAQPAWFTSEALRKRAYRPQLNRAAPRRQQVLVRLLNGWTIRRIARDLMISIRAVLNHVREICRHEGVRTRHELARKLGSAHEQPLTQDERAAARRARVQELILQGCSYQQIMKQLHTDFSTVNRDTYRIYQSHGVNGRRALARKLGVELPSIHSQRRAQIREQLSAGQTYRQIATALGVNRNVVHHHAKCIRREERAHSAS